MLKAILVVLAVIGGPLLWMTTFVPLIARSFGVPYKIGTLPIELGNQRPNNKRESFWLAGLLGWGIGLFLLGTLVRRFIDEKPQAVSLFFEFVLCLLIGSRTTNLSAR